MKEAQDDRPEFSDPIVSAEERQAILKHGSDNAATRVAVEHVVRNLEHARTLGRIAQSAARIAETVLNDRHGPLEAENDGFGFSSSSLRVSLTNEWELAVLYNAPSDAWPIDKFEDVDGLIFSLWPLDEDFPNDWALPDPTLKKNSVGEWEYLGDNSKPPLDPKEASLFFSGIEEALS